MDRAIAAIANLHGVRLLSENAGDFAINADLVNVQAPDESGSGAAAGPSPVQRG